MQTWISRVVASIIASLAVFLAAKFRIALDADSQARLTEATVAILLVFGQALWGVIYGPLHKFLDRHLNPDDTADSQSPLRRR